MNWQVDVQDVMALTTQKNNCRELAVDMIAFSMTVLIEFHGNKVLKPRLLLRYSLAQSPPYPTAYPCFLEIMCNWNHVH